MSVNGLKDTIYIDVEDDITSVIGKVKAAKNNVVALVPPKRAGALQSAVNLKLLQKAAADSDKQIALITGNHTLMALASGLKIPVAKNLQTKPEIPNISVPKSESEEVINGLQMPVGALATAAASKKEVKSAADEISDKVEFIPDGTAEVEEPKDSKVTELKNKVKNKIPDFDSFRNRLFLFGGGGALLVAFLFWALFIAPEATITINAKTAAVNISKKLSLQPDAKQSDTNKLILKPDSQNTIVTQTTEFEATGKKDIGKKASGSMKLNRTNVSNQPISVPKGTKFTSGSFIFVSTQDATLAATSVGPGGLVQDEKTVSVEAERAGTDYNLSARTYSSNVDGFTATGSEMTGGSSEEVTVATQADVDKAKEGLSSVDIDNAKNDIKKLFTPEYLIIEESFISEKTKEIVTPSLGEKATGKVKLTLETTYSMKALARSDVSKILDREIDAALRGKTDQQSYSNGENTVTFQDFNKVGKNFEVNLITTGFVGPKIDVVELADRFKNKRFGEIEAIVNELPGVSSVDIDFSPFWVNQAPGNSKKINVKLTVANE